MKLAVTLLYTSAIIGGLVNSQNTSTVIGKSFCYLTGMNIFETNGNSKITPYAELGDNVACSMLGKPELTREDRQQIFMLF